MPISPAARRVTSLPKAWALTLVQLSPSWDLRSMRVASGRRATRSARSQGTVQVGSGSWDRGLEDTP